MASGGVARRATDQILRNGGSVNRSVPNGTTYILASNVPRTAIPADLKRLCVNHKVENVTNIELDYKRFAPTGRAWLTLSSPNFTHYTIKALDRTVVGGNQIRLASATDPGSLPARTRGVKGRLEAAERGLVLGNGPGGLVSNQGRSVVMYGLPGKITNDAVREYLKQFKLAGAESGEKEIIKLESSKPSLAMKSQHFIRLASVPEAHRLVRKIHMTFFEPDIYGTKYPIRAHVMY